ncbi:hypothetical protein Mpop_5454 (plasmid) [Methylorubrum populi BJ001]|uniref:Uncharacterized protein n=1 Tax=Methylorubrum populi (strain ATCC BAA-705 / NCIMB 13946 / BJ001) TaxID=441620 RepID=B1ZM70_METPB|nr:hypothetical protein [Methylorubrum populi]ACB83543.1 hypothetical protein Mpop_5454 [Methylorubrum populi BJ001]
MAPEAQALILRNTDKNDEVARVELSNTCGVAALSRDPYGFGALLAELRALDPANDDPELDALLDGLDAAVPADPVTDVVTSTPAPAASSSRSSPPVVVTEVVTKAPARTRRKRVRSGLRQREDARTMRAVARGRAGEVVEHLHSPSSTSSSPTSPKKNANDNDEPETTKTSTGRGRMIASWENAGELPRIIATNRALDRFGVPMAFSVNFDPKLIKAGNDNDRGLLDYMRRRIALGLKRALGETPPLWVAIETDDDGRPHLHGGIALTDKHAPAVVLGALAKAGGNWTRQGSAPADLRPQHDPDGWAVYPFKRKERTRRDLRQAAGLPPDARVGLYAASAELLAEGRHIHEEQRQVIGRR